VTIYPKKEKIRHITTAKISFTNQPVFVSAVDEKIAKNPSINDITFSKKYHIKINTIDYLCLDSNKK
jgi:hypothetical protein